MGFEVGRDRFEQAEYAAFVRRLEDSVEALSALLARPRFGLGEPTIGAELEVSVVGPDARPLHCNEEVMAESVDARLTTELLRFNLEYNLGHVLLAGRPFASLQRQLASAFAEMTRATRSHGGRIAMVGILPTLGPDDVTEQAMTGALRYRALSSGLRRLRGEPFVVAIDRDEAISLERDDVGPEGACTSFQVHLRVDPGDFAHVFNAAQLATAPVLAAAANSPILLERLLWHETRIALLEQATDDRDAGARERGLPERTSFGRGWVSASAAEPFAEAVELHRPLLPIVDDEDPIATVAADEVPALRELRLHHGTVWRWNRAIYDPHGGGHLRIELRALPSGPTAKDMAANAALLVGLTLALAPEAPVWLASTPFEAARANLHAAARDGLEAILAWPGVGGELRQVTASELLLELLAVARGGLVAHGVEPEEVDELLTVVEERVCAGQTGAVWQRQALGALEPSLGRHEALAAMLERYLMLSASGEPVHRWPLPSSA